MMKHKKIIPMLFTFIIACFMSFNVFADEIQVFDEADLLDESQEESVAQAIIDVEKETNWDIMALLTDDAQGYTTRDYGEMHFNENTTSDDGVVFVIDLDNGEVYIVTTGESMYYLTDDAIEDMLDAAWPDASNGNYADALVIMAKQTLKLYDAGADGNYIYDEETGKILSYAPKKLKLEFLEILIAFGVAVAGGGVTVLGINASNRCTNGGSPYSLAGNSNIEITDGADVFVNQTRTSVVIQTSSSGSGSSGGGGSRSHSGAGGRSFGGGGRKL